MSVGRPDWRVRILGPVDVVVDGAVRPVPGRRRKSVLAVLALHAGEAVSTDLLIDIVWGDSPPATVANALQNHVSFLRGVLGGRTGIVASSPGYALELPATGTDAGQAAALIRTGLDPREDRARAAARLRGALDLWRGPALSDVTGVGWFDRQAEQLEHLRIDGVQALVELRLGAGEHHELVAELERLTEHHPLREHLCRQLMLALHRSGRPADALAAYRRLRRSLNAELGIDPGASLRDLAAAIRRGDGAPDRTGPVRAGRTDEVAEVDAGGDAEAALARSRLALQRSRGLGHDSGQARALTDIARCLTRLGELHTAVEYAEQALALHEKLGDPGGQAAAWHALGRLHFRLSRPARGAGCYRRAITLSRAAGAELDQALALDGLGDGYAGAGDLAGARRSWHQAASLLDGLGHPGAGAVRAKFMSASREG